MSGQEMDVEKRSIQIIAEHLGIPESDVGLTATFSETLGADSLDLVELTLELEDEFAIEISDYEARGVLTVGDAIALIAAKRQLQKIAYLTLSP